MSLNNCPWTVRRPSEVQLPVREADVQATNLSEFWLGSLKQGCNCDGQHENQPTQPAPKPGANQPGAPTCDHERGACGLRATGTTVLARILASHLPKQQLGNTALLSCLSACVSLQLQATLAPDHSSVGDRQLTPQASRGAFFCLQILQ